MLLILKRKRNHSETTKPMLWACKRIVSIEFFIFFFIFFNFFFRHAPLSGAHAQHALLLIPVLGKLILTMIFLNPESDKNM